MTWDSIKQWFRREPPPPKPRWRIRFVNEGFRVEERCGSARGGNEWSLHRDFWQREGAEQYMRDTLRERERIRLEKEALLAAAGSVHTTFYDDNGNLLKEFK
jgi:hypothetical protein